MMNEDDFGLRGSDKIGEQGEAPHSSNQQQVHGYHQQQTPPYTDNENYWYYDSQQQGSYEGYGNNQFGVSPEVSGGFYDGYYGGQQYVIPDHIGNQFGSPSTHMDWGCYREEHPYEGYYNTQGSSPVNMNHGYYGRAQNAIDQQSDIFVNFPNTGGGYYSGQPNGSDFFGMQPSIDAQAAAEWGKVRGMDYDEFSSYHNGYYQGPVRCHSMPDLQEQNLAEQPCYYEVLYTDSSYSAPNSNTYFLQNTNYTPSACLNRLPSDGFVPTGGSDCPWNSISALAGDFGRSYNTNPQINTNLQMNSNPTFNTNPCNSPSNGPGILYGPGRLQGNNPTRGTVSTNSNSAFITSRLINTNPVLMTAGFPPGGGNSTPICGNGRSQTNNSIDCGVFSHPINTNSFLIKLPGHRRPGPQPPRWRYEDAISTTATPPSLSESSSTDEDEREEESPSNIYSGLFLSSMLQAPTIFDNLARVGAISGIPAPIPHCPYILKGRCEAALGGNRYCSDRVHFKRVVHAHTDVRLGDCSFLDSCDLADKCPYIHYALELPEISEVLFDRLIEEVDGMPRQEVDEILEGDVSEIQRQEVDEIPREEVDEVPREEVNAMLREEEEEEEEDEEEKEEEEKEEKEVDIRRLADNVGLMRVMDKPDVCFSNLIDQ